jgi:FHS family glucose/mannose:H+ symporter-like MFS transporter
VKSVSSRRALFACACLGLLTFGIVFTMLGSVLPSIIERFGIDKAQAGGLFVLMTLGILAGSLVFGPMVDRYGYKGILLAAIGFTFIGLEGIAFAPSLALLRVAIVIIGFAGGIVNGGTNALVADISGGERGASLNLLGVFFGIGAVGVPFILATLTGRFTQSALIASIGALVVIPMAVIAVTAFPAPKQPQGFPIAAAAGLLKDPLFLLMGLMLFLESGLENSVGGWTSTFVQEELEAAARPALVILSLYWLGMTLGRLALGSILRRAPPFTVLYVCLAIALVGSALLLTTHSVEMAAVAVFLLGLGFAAMFPNVLGFIGDRYADLSGTAFSLVIAMALVGGMLLPFLAGILGGRYGMRGSFVIVPVALVILAILLGILKRGPRRTQSVR